MIYEEISMEKGVLPIDSAEEQPLKMVPLDGGDYFGNYYNYADIGAGNSNGFGIMTIEIIGQRLPEYSDYSSQYVSLYEFNFLNGSNSTSPIDNSGGSGGLPSGCGYGQQLVNWDFVEQLEGNSTTGSVPKDANGNPLGTSGVTIASGFDIGKHNVNDLHTMGLSSSLINTLSPYTGKTGQAAVNYLAQHPLSISVGDAQFLTTASHAQTLARVTVAYDSAVNQAGAFNQLPSEAQTVISSVSFQYGNLANKTPHFWDDVISKNWTATVAELRNFHDAYSSRRNVEADLLQQAINNGSLKNNQLCGI